MYPTQTEWLEIKQVVWVDDDDDDETRSLNCGHQRAYSSSPR
jgi:hypothetical protein